MPRLIPFRLAAACALAVLLTFVAAGPANAKGVPAQLRVVTGQKVLADQALRTGTTAVPTSRAATCFGKDKGGSGKSVKVAGATALGLLAQAARSTDSLRPLLVTDAFSFGLGICAIGGVEASGEGYWQLRVNHQTSEVGGDSVKLKRGDSVLWYLTPGYEASTEELWLKAPRRARSGKPFAVRVFAYDEKGNRKPVAGVRVSGATRRTNAAGRTVVTLRHPVRLIARNGKYIPSNRVAVCVGRRCPRA